MSRRGGRVLPVVTRANRASDTPVASPGPHATLARHARSRGRRRPLPARPRERACRRYGPECLPSIEDPRPATLFRAPGSGLPGAAAWPPRSRFTKPLRPPASLRRQTDWVPVHAPRCQREIALVWTSASLDDFCNRIRRAGTPFEPRILAREWALSPPLPAGTSWVPVASARRCVTAPEASEPRPASDGSRSSHSTLVDETGRGPKRSSEGELRALDEAAHALLVTLRAPGSSARSAPRAWRAWRRVAPTEVPFGCRLAKGGTVERTKVLSFATKLLRERGIAPTCAPEPGPHHAASHGGIARGSPRLFRRGSSAPL
jgi:hypothetical protein